MKIRSAHSTRKSSPRTNWLLLCVSLFVVASNAQAQNVINKGTLTIEETDVSPRLNGSEIIPPLQEDEGMIRILVADNLYFDADDVVQWIKENRLSIQGLKVDNGKARKRPDESIVFRFNFRFLSGTNNVARRVQIRKDEFNTYYRSHRFHKQQVTTLTLKVEKDPIFDQPLVVNGNLTVNTNVDGAEIIAIDQDGTEKGRKFAVGAQTELELPVGEYRIVVRLTGYQEKRLDGVKIARNQTTTRQVNLSPVVVAAQGQGFMQDVTFNTNVDRVNLTLLAEDGSQKSFLAFNNVAKGKLAPGNYNVIATLDGFQENTFSVMVRPDSAFVSEVRMKRPGSTKEFLIKSTPNNVDVFINGELVGTTPFEINKPERDLFYVELRKPDYKDYTDTVDFALIDEFEINAKMQPSYFDVVAQNPEGTRLNADLYIDGTLVGKTPFHYSNPLKGKYTFRLECDGFETLERTVLIPQKGYEAFVFNMNRSFLEISAVNEEGGQNLPAQLFIDGQKVGVAPYRVTNLTKKKYDLRLVHPGYEDVEKTVLIGDKGNASYTYKMKKQRGVLRVANAQYTVPVKVKIEGQGTDTDKISGIAKGEMVKQGLRAGEYEVKVSAVGFKTQNGLALVDNGTTEFFYQLEPKSKFGSFTRSLLFPGTGQMYWGQKGKGWLMFLGFYGSVAGTFHFSREYGSAIQDYNNAKELYRRADAANVQARASEMDEAFDTMQQNRNTAIILLGAAAGIYGVNVIDRLFAKSPKRMMRKNRRDTPLSDAQLKAAPGSLTLSIPLGRK